MMDIIKKIQAIRKIVLAVTPRISRFLIPEAIEKTAHNMKRIQPHNSKLNVLFFLLDGINFPLFQDRHAIIFQYAAIRIDTTIKQDKIQIAGRRFE